MSDKVIVSKSKLTAIGDAIREKAGVSGTLTLDEMASKISNIQSGGSTINVMKTLLDGTKNANYLFQKYPGTSVDDLIGYDDTENVTTMNYMFKGCTNLQTIPQLNTSKVTAMIEMFHTCKNLQTIPELDTSNVTNMYSTFHYCDKLQTIPQLDTSNANNMTYMFYHCDNLQTIDITSLDKVKSSGVMSNFAAYCYRLTKLIIRTMTVIPPLNTNSFSTCYHFTGGVNATYNPEGLKDGRIYIPDDYVEQLKQATNWSAYADIIVPLSTLEE